MAVIARGRIVAEGTPATLGGRASALARVTWADGSAETETPTQFVQTLAGKYDGEIPGSRSSAPPSKTSTSP